MRRLVTLPRVIVLGLLPLFAGFPIYASFIYNLCFSDAAKLASTIEKGSSCQAAQDRISEYALRSGDDAHYGISPIVAHPEWQHMDGVSQIILLDDDSTPFDHIAYHVFCNSQQLVVDTLFVGD